jgi:protein Hikeshi
MTVFKMSFGKMRRPVLHARIFSLQKMMLSVYNIVYSPRSLRRQLLINASGKKETMEVEPEPSNGGGGGGAFLPPPAFPLLNPLGGAYPPPRPVFGLIVPGFPVRTDFSPVTATQFSLTLPDLPLRTVTEMVLFATDVATSIPPDCGVLCYWQITRRAESTGFALWGALTAAQPSALFRTGWSEQESVASMLQNDPTTASAAALTIGLSIEPWSQVQNVVGAAARLDVTNHRLLVAHKIALDLFRFMQSFDTGASGSAQLMTVPKNIFDRWYQRFETRFRRDPNFFLKSNE